MLKLRQRDVLEAVLDLIDQRNGDDWYDECCHYCQDDCWHRRNSSTEAVPRCECPCHAARKVLDLEDALTNPKQS